LPPLPRCLVQPIGGSQVEGRALLPRLPRRRPRRPGRRPGAHLHNLVLGREGLGAVRENQFHVYAVRRSTTRSSYSPAPAPAPLGPERSRREALRCDLLLDDAQRRAGDTGYRATVQQAIESRRAITDGERFARAVLTTARPGGFMTSANVVDTELSALYEEAAGALGERDSLLRARLLGQLTVELTYVSADERRDALAREAVAIARRVGDRTGAFGAQLYQVRTWEGRLAELTDAVTRQRRSLPARAILASSAGAYFCGVGSARGSA
jgi:hypothetical protein